MAEPVTPPVSQIPTLWGDWYVVADADFATLPAEAVGTGGTLTVYDWPGSSRVTADAMLLAAALDEAIPVRYDHLVADRLGATSMIRQTLGLSMFAGVFVSLLRAL